MRVIGHEFHIELESLQVQNNNIFAYLKDYQCMYTESGRSCIRTVSQLAKDGEILVPFFACLSIVESFDSAAKPVYYRVNRDFTIDFDDLESKITPNTKAIYVIPYFGKLLPDASVQRLLEIKRRCGITIIEDTTHSIFSSPCSVGDYCLSSLRKWFPVPDGGVLYAAEHLDALTAPAMKQGGTPQKLYPQIMKTLYLRDIGPYKPLCDDLFVQIEKDLDDIGHEGTIYALSDLSRFLYSCFDVPDMVRKRQENQIHLRQMITSPLLTFAFDDVSLSECLFQLVCYCKERDAMRDYLIEQNIYPSVLWRTNDIDALNSFAESDQMGREIISFAIDQRYTKEDMEYVAKAVNRFAPS